MGMLTIRRRRYRRKGYRRENGVYVHPAQVPGVIYRAKDRGLPGRGPKLVTGLKKGAMTNIAIKHGYIKEGEAISDIPKGKMDDFARDLVKSVGAGRAMKMVNVQIVFRKRSPNGFKDKMLVTKNALKKSRILKIQR